MRPIPVRAHGVIGLGHLLLAAGFLASAAYYGDALLGVIGLLNLWFAYSWSITPTFTLFRSQLETYSRLGTVRRRTYFTGLDQLEARGRQLYLRDVRLPVADATLARSQDWHRVVEAVDAARAAAPSD